MKYLRRNVGALAALVAILNASLTFSAEEPTIEQFGFQGTQVNNEPTERALLVIMAQFAPVAIASIDNATQIRINVNSTLTASNLTLTVRRSGTIVRTLVGSMISGSNIISVNTTSGIQVNDQISSTENEPNGNIQPVAPFDPAHTVAYFDSLIFDPLHPLTTQSMYSYFKEISNGRFLWTKAGIIAPLPFPASQRRFTYPGADRSQEYYSNMIASAMISEKAKLDAMLPGIDIGRFDRNGDHEITPDELQIMIITNDSDVANRNAGFTKPPGFSYGIRAWQVAALSDSNDFATRCHELCHGLGAIDLYGGSGLSTNLTLMGGTFGAPNATPIYHLDPWHKMHFGWSRPRIRSLQVGGIETIPAAQMLQVNAPIIYYDPDPERGTREFFMFEYRTASSPNGSGYDGQVAGNGLVIWRVQLNAAGFYFNVPNLIFPLRDDNTVWSEGPPTFARGSTSVWTAASPSPVLAWADGTESRTRFLVRAFNIGDPTITIEVFAAEDTWVDFAYPGVPSSPETGAFTTPFNTVDEGVGAVSWGGILHFKAGSTPVRPKITKPMTLEAYNGPVIIGWSP